MAENSFKIKVETETDFQNVKDLRKELDDMKDQKISVKADVDTGRIQELQNELDQLSSKGHDLQDRLNYLKKVNVGFDVHDEEIAQIEKELDNISKRQVEIYTEIDDINLQNAKKEVDNLDGEKVIVDIDTDTNEIKTVRKEVNDIDGEKVQIDVDADDSQLKTVRKEVDDLNGEKVQVDVDVDDSQVKAVKKEISDMGSDLSNSLGSASNAVTGVVAGMAGKSIWDTIYGTSKRAETNQILLKNMADTSVAYQDLYKTIDSTTDQSLISMQSLIPALNGIQSATQSSGATINSITPGVAQFGQYVLALTGSEAKAESAMFDLSKGIKGLYASLDQYGITEDALMHTGLWSGKEDDVEGYIAAVNQVTGSTDELMSSTQGLEALMGKAFSRGGKRLGQDILPHVKNLLQGFLNLDDATGGWLSTMMLMGGGALTGLTTFLSTAGQVINGMKMMKEAYIVLRDAEILEGIAGWFSISWMLVAIAIAIALGLAIWYLYENVDWFREGVDNLIAGLSNLVNYILSSVMGTFNWLSSLFTEFTAQLGLNTNDWTQAILGFILFLPQLGFRLTQLFVDAIAKAAGFGDDFTNTMINGAINTVNGFISYITSLPGKLKQELDSMLAMAGDFALRIADMLSFGGASMVYGWITGSGEHSPGFMYDALLGELTAMVGLPSEILGQLVDWISQYGGEMANALTQSLLGLSFDEAINNILWLLTNLQGLQDWIFTAGGLIPASVDLTGNMVMDTIIRVITFVGTLPVQLAMIFANTIAKTLGFGNNFVQGLVSRAMSAVQGFSNAIQGIPQALQNCLNWAYNIVMNSPLVQALQWLGQQAANAFSILGLGQRSPGKIVKSMKQELEWTKEAVYTSDLANYVGRLGSKVSDSFNPSFNDVDLGNFTLDNIKSSLRVSNDNENGGVTYVFNLYGDIDNEDRMKQFLDYAKRELHWNNETAGRDING